MLKLMSMTLPLFIGLLGLLCGSLLPSNARAYDIAISLAEAEQLALSHNRDLRLARRLIDAADADILTAATSLNPTLSISTSHFSSSRPPTSLFKSTPAEDEVRIEKTFERGNKRGLRIAQAENEHTATQLDFENTVRQIRFEVRNAWFDLKQAEQHNELSEIIAVEAERILSLARLRFKAGDLSGADLGRFEADAARAQADKRSAENWHVQAQTQLAILLADEEHAQQLVTRGDWQLETTALPQTTDIDTAITQRADVLAATARVEAARRQVELQQAKRTRDVTISLQYERKPEDYMQPRNSVGLGVSIPLFLGDYFEGDIRRAHAELAFVQDQLEALRARIQAKINRLSRELQRMADRWQALQERALPSARRTARAAELAFSKGAISALEFLDALSILRTAELDALQARADFARARAALDATLETTATTVPPSS